MLTIRRWIEGRRRSLAALRRRAAAIERWESSLTPLEDDRLRKRAAALRYRACSGESLDDLVEEGFALVREAARRTLGMRHFDVQLIGGLAMHHGCVAEMQTGEGKTLTATLPTAVAAFRHRGAHVATANDYLTRRDAEMMRPIYEALGLTVGVIQASSGTAERRQAYRADVTYGTAKEFGFDFLRQRLERRRRDENDKSDGVVSSDDIETSRFFMLVDEADALLLDEARTPLIVSAAPEADASAEALHRWSWQTACDALEGEHFRWTEDGQLLRLTPAGRRLVRHNTPEVVSDVPPLDLYDAVESALLVRFRYRRDRHYVVRGEEVVIVDEFTGRLAEGRRWRDGIHQVIEAREGVPISAETGQAARITLQNFLLRYERLAGMTGTAANSQRELSRIYDLDVIRVPTHRPPRREYLETRVFGTEEEKWLALVDEVLEVHATGRPILIGTRTIETSLRLSRRLSEVGVPHRVLNAHHAEIEAAIVAKAGQRGAVTVATNMAGRGTDIRLDDETFALGGLFVLGTELHESQRIDRQLIGRCGRQGDPGAFRQYLSLEDEILRSGFGAKRAEQWARAGSRRLGPLEGWERRFREAQRRVERRHFQQRRSLMEQERERRRVHLAMGQDPYLDAAG